jgi:hypothetical protein
MTRRVPGCSISTLIDTTLLMAGIITAGCYFDGPGGESEIRSLSDALYRRVDWQWAQNGLLTVSQGWKPQCGFLHYGWEGYNEATIVYVLGIGSPPHPREVTTLPSLESHHELMTCRAILALR